MDRRISRNHGSSQNDERNGSQKKRAQFHMELPLNQPLLRAVYKLDAAYPAQRVFATRYFPDVPRLVPPTRFTQRPPEHPHRLPAAETHQPGHSPDGPPIPSSHGTTTNATDKQPRPPPVIPVPADHTGADRHCLALTTLHSHSPGTLQPRRPPTPQPAPPAEHPATYTASPTSPRQSPLDRCYSHSSD
jgi:hypothetical protein